MGREGGGDEILPTKRADPSLGDAVEIVLESSPSSLGMGVVQVPG